MFLLEKTKLERDREREKERETKTEKDRERERIEDKENGTKKKVKKKVNGINKCRDWVGERLKRKKELLEGNHRSGTREHLFHFLLLFFDFDFFGDGGLC